MSKNRPDILVIHGPNLNMLGVRETSVYGKETLDDINKGLREKAEKYSCMLDAFQSNSEGELIGRIQSSLGRHDGILINPGAYTHTSIGIRDALLSVALPVVEVHMSNIHKREEFRHKSYISDIAVGVIAGFGVQSYFLGFDGLLSWLKNTQ